MYTCGDTIFICLSISLPFQNPVGGVSEIAKFLGLDQDVGVFEDAVEKTKFEVMKAKEAPALIDNPMVTVQTASIERVGGSDTYDLVTNFILKVTFS